MKATIEEHFKRNYDTPLKHLKLKGLQPKTIEAYSRAIRRIGAYFDHQIDDLSEAQLADYFTDLLASHSWSTVKLDLYGLKFYYTHVLRKPGVAPNLIKPPKTKRLPDIVTVEEVQQLFLATQILSYRVFFFTLYSLGLRLGEGLRLKVGDIDAERARVHVRDAKGNQYRLVPLPAATLRLLRRFWHHHRHPVLLFPNRQGGLKGAHRATTPLDRGGVQMTLRTVAAECGLKKDHSPQSSPQLCDPSDRGGRRSAGGAEDLRPPFDSHHRQVYPSHRSYREARQHPHQRPDEWLFHRLGDSPMIRLSSIIETFKSEFLAHYQDQLLPSHRQALAALKCCRTALSPRMQAQCVDCDAQRFVPHSCGHRACPHCQHHESQQWLERQLGKQVPGAYFLLTFTLPAEFRALAFAHQRTLYALLMQCSWETLRTFSLSDKQLQGIPGAVTVLHTHSRRLDYHPHVHLVMPAAAIDAKRRLWRTKTGKGGAYLFNHKALAKVFRAKMLAALVQAELTLPRCHPQKWVVDCMHVGSGEKALVYLGRYLYRGVLQEKDILACEKGQVTFRYRNSKTRKLETRTLSGADFLWLLLRHVLPKGFRRARNFGFLHPNSKRLIRLLHMLFKLDPGRTLAAVKKRPPLRCPCCGGEMKIVRTRILLPFPRHPTNDPPKRSAEALVM
jgi:site-specific recombinase XerD